MAPELPTRRRLFLPAAQEMQDREIEKFRILEKGEMAGVGKDQEPGVWDGGCDVFRVFALDGFVVEVFNCSTDH